MDTLRDVLLPRVNFRGNLEYFSSRSTSDLLYLSDRENFQMESCKN